MDLNIETLSDDNQVKLIVSGEVDVSNASALRQAVDTALTSELDALSIDLANVSYIDSTGIGVLVGAAHRVKDAQKEFSLVRLQKNVARVLELLGVSSELNVQDVSDEAPVTNLDE